MPRRYASTLGPAALCLLLAALPAAAEVLRGAQWGESRARVEAREDGEAVLATENLLVHHDTFAGIPFTINHRFRDDALWQIRYFNRSRHAHGLDFIEDFVRLRARLTRAWGEPDIDRRHWHDEAMDGRPVHEHGQLIGARALSYVVGWERDDTRVVMTLRGEKDFRIAHHLILSDGDHAPAWPFGIESP